MIINSAALDIVLQVTEECYKPAYEPFAEFTWCLATYACNQQNTNISLTALGHLNDIAERVANGEIGAPAKWFTGPAPGEVDVEVAEATPVTLPCAPHGHSESEESEFEV